MIRIEYLLNLSNNLTELGYTPYELAVYVKEMTEGKNEIKYSLNTSAGNNVKIMNIHKSKGLEEERDLNQEGSLSAEMPKSEQVRVPQTIVTAPKRIMRTGSDFEPFLLLAQSKSPTSAIKSP